MNFHDCHAVVVARNFRLMLPEDYQSQLITCLTDISAELTRKGFPFIGHIKVAAQDVDQNLFYLSIIDPFHFPETTGKLVNLQEPIMIRINAILYGIDEKLLTQIIDGSIANYC